MLESKIEKAENGKHYLVLSGSLDEEADLDKTFASIDGEIVINLRAIKRLNSLGVHRWINAISKLSERVSVVIECCSYPFALQASYVANLFGKARVISTLAPYFCASCGYNGMVLLEAGEAKDGEVPPKSCPTCSTDMQFDELDTYLSFLKGE